MIAVHKRPVRKSPLPSNPIASTVAKSHFNPAGGVAWVGSNIPIIDVNGLNAVARIGIGESIKSPASVGLEDVFRVVSQTLEAFIRLARLVQ